MESGQPTRMGNESESKADISDALTLSPNSENTQGGASKNSRIRTTATTPNASKKTWKNADLAELRSKVGLVAGALADFQGAKGIVVTQETTYTAPSGRVCKAVKLYLIVQDADLVAEKTADGLDFNLAAE